MSRYFFSARSIDSRSRVIFAGSRTTTSKRCPEGDVAQPGEQIGLDEPRLDAVQRGILLRQFHRLLVEVHAYHLGGLPQSLGVDGESARVAAEVQDSLARAEVRQIVPVVALVEEEAGLVFAARRHTKANSMLGDDPGRGRIGRAAVERFLLADVLFGEPVEYASRKMLPEDIHEHLPDSVHPG